mmetsp:Transcript_31777/g.78789  ORF Transcript_31777/g.78789 Transcript_31777/m.78789 type:complete len:203 (-) Transcript_31777:85-693(-)
MSAQTDVTQCWLVGRESQAGSVYTPPCPPTSTHHQRRAQHSPPLPPHTRDHNTRKRETTIITAQHMTPPHCPFPSPHSASVLELRHGCLRSSGLVGVDVSVRPVVARHDALLDRVGRLLHRIPDAARHSHEPLADEGCRVHRPLDGRLGHGPQRVVQVLLVATTPTAGPAVFLRHGTRQTLSVTLKWGSEETAVGASSWAKN